MKRESERANFADVVGDKFITELTVDDAIDFRNFLRDRVVQEGIAAKSANREIGQLSGMIKELNILRREPHQAAAISTGDGKPYLT